MQPNTILAGTGDFNGNGNYGIGLMKSTDGGATWVNLGSSQFTGFAVSAIAWDPENPNIITVASGRGANTIANLYRSTDGGTTWNIVIGNNNDTAALEQSFLWRENGGRRSASLCDGSPHGGQVYRSDDRGATWTKLTPPLGGNVNFGDQNSLRIAASPTSPDVVYLLDGFDKKIFKSVNAGATWSDTTAGFPNGNAERRSQLQLVTEHVMTSISNARRAW